MTTPAEPSPTPAPHPLRAAIERLLALARRGGAARSPRTERILAAVAALVFVGATYLAWRAIPEGDLELRWAPVALVALVGVPGLLLLNSVEYRLAVEAVRGRVSMFESLRTNVVASAANLLPIPGSILVRIRGARNAGASLSAATAATAIVGVAWMAVTGVLAGALQLAVGRPLLGVALGAGGLVLAVVAVTMARMHREVHMDRGLVARLLVVEVARVAVLAARFHLLLVALGHAPGVDQSLALTISVAAATAIAVFPGGLGVREVSAAGIGPLVGLSAPVALLAVAVDRLLSLAVLGVSAAAVALRDR